MEINLLGLKITVGKPTVQQNTLLPGMVEQPTARTKSINLKPRLHPITSAICWPNPGDDPWMKTALNNAIYEFDKSAKYGHFSICAIDTVLKHFGIVLSKDGFLAYERLSSIHCVKFGLMEKEVLDCIVPFINLIFKGREFEVQNNRTFNHGE